MRKSALKLASRKEHNASVLCTLELDLSHRSLRSQQALPERKLVPVVVEFN